MPDLPILFVAGFGRCGTTMLMTMLDAGGFPVTGPRPGYELPEHWRDLKPDLPWLQAQGGRAVKWIDPMRSLGALPHLTPRPVVVLMSRDLREQARSQIKAIGAPQAHSVRRWARSLGRDEPALRAHLQRKTLLYRLTFEGALATPLETARILDGIAAKHFGRRIDIETAARAVIPRPPRCAPDLTMENIILPTIADDLNARDRAAMEAPDA